MGESATADDPTVEAKPALPGQIKPTGPEADQMPKYAGLGAAAEEVGMTVAHATDDSAFLRPGGDVRQSKKRKWDVQISAPLVLWLRRCCEVN